MGFWGFGVVIVVEMVGVVIVVDLVSKRLHKRFQSWWLGRFGTEEAKRPKKKEKKKRLTHFKTMPQAAGKNKS